MEYLGALITKHEVDPLDLFSSDELETLIKTASIRLPPRSLPPNSTLLSYHRRLLEVSLKELILFFSFLLFLFSLPPCVFLLGNARTPIYCRDISLCAPSAFLACGPADNTT